MKNNSIIIIVLVIGVILLVFWLNSCEKYSSHAFPGGNISSVYIDRPEHSIHIGRGTFDWNKVAGYGECMKDLNKDHPLLTYREADRICTPYLSDPEVEEYPF
jgi:hypothetical protein